MTDDQGRALLGLVEAAYTHGDSIGDVGPVNAFNICADHVAQLLEDAFASYVSGSFGTSVFLAITSLEETCKAEILIFRSKNAPAKKGRDPLRDHKTKHTIAVRPTTFMGRLPGILGDETCQRLKGEVSKGAFNRLREVALYVHADEGGVRAPKTEVSKDRCREMLLLALESADDILVGYTDHSYELGTRFEALMIELT